MREQDLVRAAFHAGISLVLADYRFVHTDPFPAPFLDGARTVQFVRHHAKKWHSIHHPLFGLMLQERYEAEDPANETTLSLAKSGNNVQILAGTATYRGTTLVSGGGLIINGDHSGATNTVTIANAARFGGAGDVGGNVHLESGAHWVFNTNATLTLTGSAELSFADFGVTDLVQQNGSAIDWSAIADGTYQLALGTVDFTNVRDTETSKYDLGGGREAYFKNSSLELVVIPEPTTGLLLIVSVLGLTVWRRLR